MSDSLSQMNFWPSFPSLNQVAEIVDPKVIIPVVAYGLYKAMGYLDSKKIKELGETLILVGVISAPGAAAGWTICSLGGKTLAAKAIGLIVGSGITYKIGTAIITSAAKAACDAIR